MKGFNFSTQVTVRFAETDAQSVAHHSAYVVWFEVARIDYLARFREGYRSIQADGYEALTIEVNVRYGAPVRFDERVRIHARCLDLRGARFRFEYAVECEGRVVAEGSTGHAIVDAKTFRPSRLPEWLRDEIERAEEVG